MYNNTQIRTYALKGGQITVSAGIAFDAARQIRDASKFKSAVVLASIPLQSVAELHKKYLAHVHPLLDNVLKIQELISVVKGYYMLPEIRDALGYWLENPAHYFKTTTQADIVSQIRHDARFGSGELTFEKFLMKVRDVAEISTTTGEEMHKLKFAAKPSLDEVALCEACIEINSNTAKKYLANVQNFKTYFKSLVFKTIAWASFKSWALSKAFGVAEAYLTSGDIYDAFGKIDDNNFLISPIQHFICDPIELGTPSKTACVEVTNLLFAMPKACDSTAYTVVELGIMAAEFAGVISAQEHNARSEF